MIQCISRIAAFIAYALIIVLIIPKPTYGETMSAEFYFLSVSAEGLHATVKLNGLPIVIHNEGTKLTTEKMVASWLMNGINTLSVELKTLPEKEVIMGKIKVSLFLHDNSAQAPTPKELLGVLIFPEPEPESEPGPTHTLTTEFEFKKSKTRVWQDAEPTGSLSESDKTAIVKLITDLQSALIHNGAKATALQQYKIDEDAEAEGKDPSQVAAATQTTYNWLAQQPNLKAISIKESALIYTIGGQNNVVFVSQPDLSNALQIENEDLFFEVPIYVAKIKNQWTLVR